MLKGVCTFERVCVCCCVNGEQVPRTTDLGGESLFLWPLHAEKRIFYGCRILFPSSMTFITGEKHQESREWGVIIPVFAACTSEGIICPEFRAKEGTR